ncbi:MAG: tetratricopeptide repeat protein [Bacteroidetes bacterium]|nr:MAG: tetratricopeptide repeat protein [Bacteroidota bacterium]
MRKIALLILLLSIINIFSLESCFGQDWKKYIDSLDFYYNKNDFQNAVPFIEKGLFSIQSGIEKKDSIYIQTLEKSIDIYLNLDDYEMSLKLAKEDSSITSELYGKISEQHAKSVTLLAITYKSIRNYKEAELSYREALSIKRKINKQDDSAFAAFLSHTAEFFDDINKTEYAEKLNKEALDMRIRLFKNDHADIADSYVNEALYLKKQGKYEEAEPYYNEALKIYRKLNHPDLPLCLTNLAVLYKDMGRYQDAENLYKEALDIRRKIYNKPNLSLANSINNMARIYRLTGKYQQAETLFMEALGLYKQLVKGDHPILALLMNNIAEFYTSIGKFSIAENYYKESLQIYRNLYKNDNPELSNMLNNLGSFYLEMGRYSEAEQLCREALSMNRRLYAEVHPNLAKSISNMARCCRLQGKYAEAEPLYREAMTMARKIYSEDNPELANFISAAASFYNIKGMSNQAGPLYEEALRIQRKIFKNDNSELANTISNIANFYDEQGDADKAEPLYIEALEMRKRLFKEDHPDLAISISNLASFYDARHNYDKAESLYKSALEMRRRIYKTDHPDIAVSMNNLAFHHLNHGQPELALALLDSSLAMNRRLFTSQSPVLLNSIYSMAKLCEDMGKLNEAEKLYNEAFSNIQKIVSSYFPSLSEKEKGQFWNTMKGYYDSYNSFAIKSIKGNPALSGNMYDNQLATKALLFTSISKVKRRILNSRDSSLIENYKQWISLKEYLVKLYTYTKDKLLKENINLDSIENLANVLEKQISLKSELFSESYEKKKISWKTIQAFLKPDEAAIEIIRFRYREKNWTDTIIYAALIITDQTTEHPEIVLFENGNKLEGWLYNFYRENLKSVQHDKESFDLFWSKIYDVTKNVKKIYLSTDGIYNKINPSTFVGPNDKYLLEEKDIQICNSTRDIIVSYYRTQKDVNLLNSAELFGNPDYLLTKEKKKKINGKNRSLSDDFPQLTIDSTFVLKSLPASEDEILNVAKFLHSKSWLVHTHLREDALKSEVKNVSNPRVLHIATHGVFLPDITAELANIFGFESKRLLENPLLRSGLFFAGASNIITGKNTELSEEDNGILTSYEAMDLDLDHTELVVLSACETGLGEIKNGEGVYGLQRAFQTAGAKTVLMSLWSVGDESTNELMTMFYNNWVTGMSKREAFRTAQLAIFNKYKIPYIWGAFVMVGE